MSRRVMFNGKVVKISLTRRERAPLCMAAVMLAMTWASETDASPRQARHLADTQQATTARDRGSDEFKTWPPPSGGSDKSIQIAQATTPHTGALQQPPEQQRDWAESLSCELAFARRDIALLQHFEQERDRADWLAQDLDAARREVETQKALVAKAVEEASRLKEASRPNRAGESGPAELQASLQEERERSVRLEQDLAAALRNVETQTALATKAGEETSRLKQAGESQAVELQKALQQESERTARLERDLAAARHDAETQTALATKAGEETSRLKQAEESQAVELQKALQQESQRTARLEQDLTAARQNVESQTALVAKANEAKEEMSQRSRAAEASAADLRQSMQKERERADTLAQDLSLTRSAIYAYQAQTALLAKPSEGPSRLKAAAGGDAVELQKFLQQERDRTGRLEQALEAAQRDIDAQTALAAKASDEVVRLTQAAKAGAAEQIRSIQKEHERADALAQDLSMARSKIYAYEAQAAKASEEAAQHKQTEASEVASLGQSLQRERERAEQLARDLAKAGRDLDAQTERASKASEEVLRIKQAGERDSAELRGLLQRERERAEGLETEIALARLDNGAFVAKHPSPASQPATTGKAMREPFAAPARQIQDQPVQEKPAQDKQVQDQAIVARSPGDARVNPDEAVQVARLIARASLLLEQGDIGAARIVLEHVAGMGSAQAIFVLAETYDPLILPSLGTYGTHGDATRARDLYARAEAGGIKEAKARFEALRR
ncbi:coiled-coil domain-containing protein [Bradyrhizobium diazoefficiens]